MHGLNTFDFNAIACFVAIEHHQCRCACEVCAQQSSSSISGGILLQYLTVLLEYIDLVVGQPRPALGYTTFSGLSYL